MVFFFFRSFNWSHCWCCHYSDHYIAVVISILVPVLICCCLGVGAFSAIACLTKEKTKDGTVLKGMNKSSHNNNW